MSEDPSTAGQVPTASVADSLRAVARCSRR